uniref:ABC-type transport system permease component LolE n=1 Tax=uncultured bacterium CSLC2 TaxID=1091571 RepID=Q8KP05_9BACT|nr:ABC-type transport system permease component LolE [uncultured bacterium CSLC2]
MSMVATPPPMPHAPRARWWNAVRVGFFLADRQVRANKGTTLLVITVMILTFLNLLVVSGALVGIVQGLRAERQTHYSGDLILTNFNQKDSIQNASDVTSYLRTVPSIAAFSPRYVANAALEGNYATKGQLSDKPDSIVTVAVGIDPVAEEATTHFSQLLVEGEYLQRDDYDQILVGTSLLERYKTGVSIPGTTPLPTVGVGSKVRLLVNGIEHEMTIKGIIASKLQEVDLRVFVVDRQLRSLLGRTDGAVNEIAIKLAPKVSAADVKAQLLQAGIGADAKVQLPLESEPVFFEDFAATFDKLGAFLGSIGLVIAFIAIFILVFINTITRRRSIGILQAIGIQSSAIEIGYILQSVLYASVGAAVGMLVLFLVLEPYFSHHPIDFPFSNGILSVSFLEALTKASVLLVAITLASFIPARLIMRQEIVDAILGR